MKNNKSVAAVDQDFHEEFCQMFKKRFKQKPNVVYCVPHPPDAVACPFECIISNPWGDNEVVVIKNPTYFQIACTLHNWLVTTSDDHIFFEAITRSKYKGIPVITPFMGS